jgi:hypothetical protein
MQNEEPARTVHRGSFVVLLPDGWWQSERRTFISPTGTQISVDVVALPVGADPGETLRRRLDQVDATVELVGEPGATTAMSTSGREVLERQIAFRVGDTTWNARLAGWVEQGRVVVVGATAPGGPPSEDDIDRVIGGIRVSTATSDTPGADRPLGLDRSASPTPDWARLAAHWSERPPGLAERAEPTCWTADELQVCASLLGDGDVLTFSDSVAAAAPDDVRRAVVLAVTRSLVARGVVETGDDGSSRLSAPLGTAIEVALRPDLGLSVERIGRGHTGSWWFGVRPDFAAQVTLLVHGLREVAALDPEWVIAHAMALGGLVVDDDGEPRPAAHDDHEIITISLADVVAGHDRVSEVIRTAATWRDVDGVRGAIETWALGHDGEIWLAEDATDGPPTWTMRLSDREAVRREFVAGLPGPAASDIVKSDFSAVRDDHRRTERPDVRGPLIEREESDDAETS